MKEYSPSVYPGAVEGPKTFKGLGGFEGLNGPSDTDNP